MMGMRRELGLCFRMSDNTAREAAGHKVVVWPDEAIQVGVSMSRQSKRITRRPIDLAFKFRKYPVDWTIHLGYARVDHQHVRQFVLRHGSDNGVQSFQLVEKVMREMVLMILNGHASRGSFHVGFKLIVMVESVAVQRDHRCGAAQPVVQLLSLFRVGGYQQAGQWKKNSRQIIMP